MGSRPTDLSEGFQAATELRDENDSARAERRRFGMQRFQYWSESKAQMSKIHSAPPGHEVKLRPGHDD
eukprot:IDg17707t1